MTNDNNILIKAEHELSPFHSRHRILATFARPHLVCENDLWRGTVPLNG